MSLDFDPKTLIDSIPVSVCVNQPVYDANSMICDFKIVYTNRYFDDLTGGNIKTGSNYTQFSTLLSPDVSWLSLATECIKTNTYTEKTFYSKMAEGYLRVMMHCIEGKLVVVALMKITKDKQSEQQILSQNIKIEALTSELKTSLSDIQKKENSIQMLNQQLRIAAYHDSMTNLRNRYSFNLTLKDAMHSADVNKTKFGILLFDVDNMKTINDLQGHDAGDDLIQNIAVTLRRLENENIQAFRFSGDDFIVMAQNINDRQEMMRIGQKLIQALNKNGISISGGIALYPEDSSFGEDLLKFADMAKTEVKKNGKNNISAFHKIMQEKFLQKVNIEAKLNKAMVENLFQLYYQPQFDLETGSLRGFEALLRWHDNDLGWISPEQFIPLAEETNLVVPIGDWVMETGLKNLEKWEKEYNFEGILSINVSPIQFKQDDFMDKLMYKLATHPVKHEHLEIEITEGILIEDVELIVNKLNKIKELGIGISLDDFGTGYSSLRYLQMLPLTTLKIDKSFIANINIKDGVEANITESIISLVSRMGLDTIAEGVETQEQLDALKNINCKNIQGFLKGMPMPRENCERLLAGDSSAILSLENA